MQIHELDPFIGELGEDTLLAVDDGNETMKIPATSLGVSTEMTLEEAEAGTVEDARVITPKVLHDYVSETEVDLLRIDMGSFNTLPTALPDERITDDMVCIYSELGTPSAQTSDWTVTTSSGTVEVRGSISGSTTLVLYLMRAK